MESLNICLMNLDYHPVRGSGLSFYCERLSRGLVAAGHKVTVVTSQPPGTEQRENIAGVEVIRLPTSGLDRTGWIEIGYRASRFMGQENFHREFDIVHFMDVHFAFAYGRRFVATLHQSFNQRLGGGIDPYRSGMINGLERAIYYNTSKYLERMALRNAEALISVSGSTKDDFVRNYGVDPEGIRLVYNGIDTERFRRMGFQDLRQTMGLGEERLLMYAGFSTPRKGVEYLAEAMALVEDDVRLMMIGKWEPGYHRVFTNRLNGHGHKVMEMGFIDDEMMPYYYSMADVFIMPSLLEGFGYPVAESLACETPVVSTDSGALPEIVGDCGLIVPKKDPVGLAKAVNEMLSSADLRHKMGKNGRRRVLDKFSIMNTIRETERFYKDTLEHSRVFNAQITG